MHVIQKHNPQQDWVQVQELWRSWQANQRSKENGGNLCDWKDHGLLHLKEMTNCLENRLWVDRAWCGPHLLFTQDLLYFPL
jgi:hypothetical protein